METSRTLAYRSPLTVSSRPPGALVQNTAAFIGPGRTLHDLYSTLGGAAEKHANRAAHNLGLGPAAVAERIRLFFGDGSERESKLVLLQEESPGKRLEKDCVRLMKYALPVESATMQLDAYKNLVALTTLYPGIRRLFLRCEYLEGVPLLETDIACGWERSDGAVCGPSWHFHRNFAAACIADEDISTMVENMSTSELGSVANRPEGLSVIEKLLVASDCDGHSIFSQSIAVRYLGGILSLPSFWLQTGTMHRVVVQKLLDRAALLLKDAGIDSETLEVPNEITSDTEGVDLFCEALLVGVGSWFPHSPPVTTSHELWYSSLAKVLQLLREPDSEALLPKSSVIAKAEKLQSLVPAQYESRFVDILATQPSQDVDDTLLVTESLQEAVDSSPAIVEPLQDDIDTTELLNWKELRPSEPTESANAGVKKASILILGQADSGKSSLLRNFRLAFTPRQFESERLLWKTVIQLNLIHSARKILNVLEQEEQESDSPESRNSARNHRRIVQALSALETSSRYSMGGDIRSGFRMTVCPGTNPTQVDQFLRTYQRDIIVLSSLWKDSGVRRALDSRKARPQDDPGFFLDDAPRVTADNYIPTNRDIMRAKIRTMGVEEQRFVADSGPTLGTEFFIVEVGQTKRKTAVWNFMHDQVQVIMFLAPLVFWQRLDDNPEVNRVQDSLELWKETVSSQLLARITLILLFNKKDLLQAHIAEGGQMKRYVPSFGDRRNDVPTITKYFRDHFSQCSRKFSPFRRPFICYETEIIDTKSTARVLGNVHDEIIRMNVKDVEFV